MASIQSSRRAFIAAAALAFCAGPALAFDFDFFAVTGSGRPAEEARAVGRFQQLKLDTNARVVLRQADVQAVKVEADDNVVALIDTRVEDGVLIVEDNKRFKSQQARVIITAPAVTAIAASNAVLLQAEHLKQPELALSLGGSCVVNLHNVSMQRLSAAAGGSSVLKLSGRTDEFEAQAGGSSVVRAAELRARSATVSSGGSSHISVRASERLRIAAGGSSSVSYHGPAKPEVSVSGSASVRQLD